MDLTCRPHTRLTCCILSITVVLLSSLPALTQAPQVEQSFPTHNNPLVVISNAYLIQIDSWAKNEVTVKPDVLPSPIQAEEVRIKSENNKLEITCYPAKPERRIFLTLRVPARASLELKTDGNVVRVREPAEQITVSFASKELIQLGAPEESALDMQEAPRAIARWQLNPGNFQQVGIGRSRMGKGPPFLKVNAPKALVNTTLGAVQPPIRPATLAATTIARRNSSMSQALRRSAPQLIRPSARLDQASAVKPADREEGSVKLETYLVNLNVSATDRAGRAIPGLTNDDFIVEEDGMPQHLSFFSPQQSPFNLVLLLDLSGSMRDQLDLIKDTARHFLEAINSLDSVAVVTFTTDVTVVSHLTKDRDDLRDNIDYMLAPAGGTAFYDALGYALVEVLRKVKGQRNAVIAITDGEDNSIQAQLAFRSAGASIAAGSFLTFDELHDGVTEADALVYPIHLNPTPTAPSNVSIRGGSPNLPAPRVQIQTNTDTQKLSMAALTETAIKQLQSLADVSGGRFYHANRIEDLKGVFDQVAAELRTVYSMAYTPTNLNFDGRFRRIKVRVNRPDVAIRTRPGYFGR